MGRYTLDPIIGNRYGTCDAIDRIREGVATGRIRVSTLTLTEGHRLDTLAGLLLDDGRLWWVIAAMSGIGWGLQVPAGTQIVYPENSADVEALI